MSTMAAEDKRGRQTSRSSLEYDETLVRLFPILNYVNS